MSEAIGEEKKEMSMQNVPQQIPSVQAEVQELMTELSRVCTQLIIKVATCKCKQRDECPIYQAGQKIAEIFDKLQNLREKLPKKVVDQFAMMGPS